MDTENVLADTERLKAWAESLASDVARLTVQLKDVQHELAAAQERFNLVKRLLELDETGQIQGPSEMPKRIAPVESDGSLESHELELEDAVAKVLADSGEPLHIAEIRNRLIASGVSIPGRGDDANIIVRIRKFDDRFTRTARGTYALASWGLPSVDSARRSRPSKKVTRK
jgi:hypothetical protein